MEMKRTRPICMHGDKCTYGDRCRFRHPEREHSGIQNTNPPSNPHFTKPFHKFPAPGNKPAWKQSAPGGDRHGRKCFTKGCTITPYQGKALCIECHRKAVKEKSFTGKDLVTRAYGASMDEDQMIMDCTEMHYATEASVQHQDDLWLSGLKYRN